MKKLQPGDEIAKIDKEQGIAWILLPPDPNPGGFQGISPRIMDEGNPRPEEEVGRRIR